MSDEKKQDLEILPKQSTSVLDVDTEYDQHRMYRWDELKSRFQLSRELSKQSKLTVREKLKSQHVIVKQKIATTEDLALKIILQEYLDNVDTIEVKFLKKIDQMEMDNDTYMEQTRDDIFKFFDEARLALDKWSDKPERYESEKVRLDQQEQKRLANVESRLQKLELKRSDIYDRTVQLFTEAKNTVESRLKLF